MTTLEDDVWVPEKALTGKASAIYNLWLMSAVATIICTAGVLLLTPFTVYDLITSGGDLMFKSLFLLATIAAAILGHVGARWADHKLAELDADDKLIRDRYKHFFDQREHIDADGT